MSARGRAVAPVLALGGLSLLLVACNRTPAADAIRAAEDALAGAPQLAEYLPDESAAIAAALRDARVSFDERRYTDALRAAQPLPDRIAGAQAAASRRQQEKAAEWEALAREMPPRIDAIVARLGALVAGGWISSARQASAQEQIVALDQAWRDASAAGQRGEVTKAIAAARQLLASAEALASALGLKGAAALAPPAPRAVPSSPRPDPKAAAPGGTADAPEQAPPPRDPTPAATPSPAPPPPG